MRIPGIASLRHAALVAVLGTLALPGRGAAQDSSASGLTPAQQNTIAQLLPRARQLEAQREVTVENAESRVIIWRQILLTDPNNVEAKLGWEQARADLARAEEAEKEGRQVQAATAQQREGQLRQAETALRAKDLESADAMTSTVLAEDPTNARALSLRNTIRAAQRARAARRRFIIIGAVLVGIAVAVVVIIKKVGGKKKKSGGAAPAGGKAVLKVVDGVGRGRLVTIDHDVYRIGAAEGETDDRTNDLIISDSAAAISRMHCTILRRGKDFYLLDSSLNGTAVNGERLDRGEQFRLRDGDELILAGVSKLKFLKA